MRRLGAVVGVCILATAVWAAPGAPTSAAPAPAHHLPAEPMDGTILPDAAAHAGIFNQLDGLQPSYATNCRPTIRSSGTSAVGICYNYSGSGSRKFQVAALAFDGCNRWIWMYGNVGWVYTPTASPTFKWSYVYTPPGWYWHFVAAKVIVWKP